MSPEMTQKVINLVKSQTCICVLTPLLSGASISWQLPVFPILLGCSILAWLDYGFSECSVVHVGGID